MADQGGICISGPVYDQVKSKLALDFDSLGAKTLKNIDHPVIVYKVRPSPAPGADLGDSDPEPATRAPEDDSVTTFVVVAGIVMIVWAYYHS